MAFGAWERPSKPQRRNSTFFSFDNVSIETDVTYIKMAPIMRRKPGSYDVHEESRTELFLC